MAEEFDNEEFELLPHKEIIELREELKRMKESEINPTKKFSVGVSELNSKIDKLISIFEEAGQQMTQIEGGATFEEKMAPVNEKLNKILEQNGEIASALVALADMMNELKSSKPEKVEPIEPSFPDSMPIPPMIGSGSMPPPPRRRTFGL